MRHLPVWSRFGGSKGTLMKRGHNAFVHVICMILFVSQGVVHAQNIAHTVLLSGKVSDASTGSELPGAEVFVPDLRMGTTTDLNGEFAVSLPAGQLRVVTSFLGYTSDTLTLNLWTQHSIAVRLKPTSLVMSSITVTAKGADQTFLTGSNKAMTVISSKELVAVRGQTLGQTLSEIPGVTLLNTGPSISKPVIRGLHSERVVVLNAGVPQEGQQWGGEHAPEIDPFSADKIEVLKGAAGVAYGAGAIGGVIRVEPKQMPRIPGVDGSVSLNAFSNNRQGAGSLMIEGMTDLLPGLSMRLQGSTRRAGSSSAGGYVMGNTGFMESVGSATVGYAADGSNIQIYYSLFDTELGIYKGSHIGSLSDLYRALAAGKPLATYAFTYTVNPPEQRITHELWSVKASQVIPSVGSLELQYGRQNNHRQEFDAFRFFNNVQSRPTVPSFELTLTTYTVDLKLRHDPIGHFFGTIGINGMRQGNVKAGYSFLIPNFRMYSGGAYAIEEWTDDVLTLNAGLRYDYRWMRVYPYVPRNIPEATHVYENVSGSVGAIYQFASDWSFNTNIGSAFRPPGVNELYSDGVHHGTAEYEKGDPNLKNERSYSIDVTLKHENLLTHAELSVYYTSINNFISLFPNPQPALTLRGTFPAFNYLQANAVLDGFDGSIERRVSEADKIGVSVSVVRGTNRTTGEPLYQMPADRIHLTNTLYVPSFAIFQNPSIELGVSFVRRQDRFQPHVDYVDPPPGYGLVDMSIQADIAMGSQSYQASLSASNLLNKSYRDYMSRYRYYVDDPGRDIVFRLQVPFGQTQ